MVDAGFAVAIWVGVAVLALAGRRGPPRRWRAGGAGRARVRGVRDGRARRRDTGRCPPSACAAAVGVYGLLAFWLYSLALDRAPVSSATAPLIVGQTFVPGLVGVLLLGDGVRAGWWPAVVAGLVLSVGGAIFLSRDAAGRDRLRTTGAAATGSPGPAPRRGR